jgi:glyoxalase family protein
MTLRTSGIHHVTSIAGDPQRNIDFYTGVLGLRLLKLTVNFDMPETYHLYYGDHAGTPGTILTYFPWPRAPRGRIGSGQVTITSYAVPDGALDFWAERLREHGVEVEQPVGRFDETAIAFTDPDGIVNEIVSRPGAAPGDPWHDSPVSREQAIVGFSGVTLRSRSPEQTAAVLTDLLGFEQRGTDDGRTRFASGSGAIGSTVDVVDGSSGEDGTEGVGTVHHVAWRTKDDAEQLAWQAAVAEFGLMVTPVRDRSYFHSIYFREPGGVLFEIATDPPGFAIDEPVEGLGSRIMLPPWVEPQRAEIERGLQPVRLPSGGRVP